MSAITYKEWKPSKPSVIAFLEHREFDKNLSARTLWYYQQVFKTFEGCEDILEFRTRVRELRKRGIKPTSLNCWIRGLNAYFHFAAGKNGKCHPACSEHPKLDKQKEERTILRVLTSEQIEKIVKFKPQDENQSRAWAMAVLILDTGMRIEEVTTLQRSFINMENCTIKFMGKGRKEREVSLSDAGRRAMYRWMKGQQGMYVFPCHSGTHISIRNAQRNVKSLLEAAGIAGIRTSPHTLRHSFAVNYLKRGGNLEYLRRLLGHASILITQRYLQGLQHEDVAKVHNSFSPLAGM